MKKIITIITIIISLPLYSQWALINAGSNEFLNDIYCINENVVVAIGNNGTILKTSDGGVNWTHKPSGTNFKLFKLQFCNANVGYICGYNNTNGLLLKTVDGGETWSPIAAAGTSLIYDFSIVDDNILYFTDVNGILRKTTNGGNSFETVVSSGFIQRIQFVNENVGFGSTTNYLMKTIDGGGTWSTICPLSSYPANGAFFFLNDQVGFVNTTSSLTRTTDGGQNFTDLDSLEYPIFRLFATSENIVWGVAGQDIFGSETPLTVRGEVFTSGGFNRTEGFPVLKSIHFAGETTGYGVALNGIYKNTTGTMLGINSISERELISVYPNPASSYIEISFNKISNEVYSIEILDNLGKVVFSETRLTTNPFIIDTKSFSKGFYFLNFASNQKRHTQKVIIK